MTASAAPQPLTTSGTPSLERPSDKQPPPSSAQFSTLGTVRNFLNSSCVPQVGALLGESVGSLERVLLPLRVGALRWIESTQVSWLSLSVGFPARVRSCRRSINRASSSINSGLLCLPPLWISSSLCINSAKFSMTSSKAGKAGWLPEMVRGSQGRKLVKSEQFYSIP
jgi:hypothetical protein